MFKTSADEYGRVVVDTEALIEALYEGYSAQELNVEPSPALDAYNAFCERFNKPEHRIVGVEVLGHSPEEEHAKRSKAWNIPEEYLLLDLEEYLFQKCNTVEEIERVQYELELFRKRDFEIVLRLMIYLVAVWRKHDIVWGVGRGSSVCSFVLYLIGINRINPLTYNLDIKEFLRY